MTVPIGLGPLNHARYRLEARVERCPGRCPSCRGATLLEVRARAHLWEEPLPTTELLVRCEICLTTYSRPSWPLRLAGVALLLPLVVFMGTFLGGALVFACVVADGWLRHTTPDAATGLIMGLGLVVTGVGFLIPTRRLIAGLRPLVRVEVPVDDHLPALWAAPVRAAASDPPPDREGA